MITKNDFSLQEFPDGSVCLECGDGAERDLVFASSAMRGDPDVDKQREILEFIMSAIQQNEKEGFRIDECDERLNKSGESQGADYQK